jgi:magnesium-dependent phosphatase 1
LVNKQIEKRKSHSKDENINIINSFRAKEALSQLRVPELDITVIELVDYIEVYSGSKLRHFKALSKKSGISCDEMLFFDDESRNREVTSLGIHFVLVDPKVGVTLQQFEEALHDYAENQTLDK